jgi:hypothetical protein
MKIRDLAGFPIGIEAWPGLLKLDRIMTREESEEAE